MIYLACPYSHDDPTVRAERFMAANAAAGQLMKQGLVVFSPISQTHPIAEQVGLPLGWDYWEQFDTAFIEKSEQLIVLRLDGWANSLGVRSEIALAIKLGIPVTYMEPVS